MLSKSIFLNLSSRTSAKIFYAIALYPFLYLITLFLPTNFMQVGGEAKGLSGLDFYNGILMAQSQFAIPLIMMTYFVGMSFYDEINSGKLIFYKDIRRTKLLNAKLISLASMYMIYFIGLFISSELLYFTFIKNFDYASGVFLPATQTDLYADVLSIVSTIGVSFIAVIFAILLSMRLSTGFTILGVILLFMVISISPLIKGGRYLFPNSYTDASSIQAFFIQLGIILIMTLVYCTILYKASLRVFKKTEY